MGRSSTTLGKAVAVGGGMIAVGVLVACGPSPVDEAPALLEVTANQEPVAVLELPATAAAGEVVAVSGRASFDVDGEVVSASLRFDGEEVAGFEADHVFTAPGLHTVELWVEDDQGRSGRGRARIVVTAPLDPAPPILDAVEVRVGAEDGPSVEEGDALVGGGPLLVRVAARDGEGNLAELAVSAASALGPIVGSLVGSFEPADDGTGEAWFELAVPDAAGPYTVHAVARDLYGNEASTSIAFEAYLSSGDQDGDGLSDGVDPAPLAFNGMSADLFLLDGFPRDLLGRQIAEDVEDEVRSGLPVWSGVVTTGFLAAETAAGAAEGIPGLAGAPATPSHWAVLYRGLLVVPEGADAVVVSTTADDVGVVFLNGQPVASADEEYALDFFRLDRLAATSAALPLVGDAVPLELLVANEEGPAGWSFTFQFFSGGVPLVETDVVGQGRVLLP